MSFACSHRIQSSCSRHTGRQSPRHPQNQKSAVIRRCRASSDASDVETTLDVPTKGKQAVLELRVEVSTPLPAISGKGDAREFVRTDGAVLAMMDGGPDEPQRLEDGTWRVLAPGFAGRLFFVGPAVEFFPVNEFEVVHSDDDDAQVAQVKLNLNRGSMQGTPASVVDWINKAYTTDRTTTVVTVDTSLGKVVTSVDVRISITVPKLFSLVPVRKIESAMEASAAASTESALRTVCEAVGEAWVTCNTAEGTLRV